MAKTNKREMKEKMSRRAKIKNETDAEVEKVLTKMQEMKEAIFNHKNGLNGSNTSLFKPFKFKNKSQKDFFQKIISNKITIGTGAAGTAKTLISCAAALELLKTEKVDGIVITKPIVEAGGENLGYLPGNIEDKISAYMVSYLDAFEKLINKKYLDELIQSGTISFIPAAFLRGRNFSNKFIIVDEAQSFNIKQLMLIVTRMSEGSSMVIVGDQNQNDISEKYLALNFFKEMIGDIEGVATHLFTNDEIVRDPILIEITNRYETAKREGKLPLSQKGL